MKNEWDDYSDDFEDYENDLHWQVRLNGEILGNFDTKDDALWCMLDDIDSETNNLFYQGVGLVGYNDKEELFNDLYDMCAVDFYDHLETILDNFDLSENEYHLINLDNEEPEFGEL